MTQNTSKKKKTVLVIDDDDTLLSLNREILETEGFEVFTTSNGNQAFSLLSQIPMPNLILLDMQMEGMSGLEFLILLEKKLPKIIENVPVIFLTAMDKVPASKAAGVIKKPMDIDDFLKTVHHFIEKNKNKNEKS